MVARTTASTIGISRLICPLRMTLSMRNFELIGRASPQTRLTTMRAAPASSRRRRGFISAHTSGRSVLKRSEGLGLSTAFSY